VIKKDTYYKEYAFSDSYHHYWICGNYIKGSNRPVGVINYYNLGSNNLIEQFTYNEESKLHGKQTYFWSSNDFYNGYVGEELYAEYSLFEGESIQYMY